MINGTIEERIELFLPDLGSYYSNNSQNPPYSPLCQRGKLLSPSLAKGSTRLTILSISKERGSPCGVGKPTPQGEGRFSDQTAQSIRFASRHKRYLSE